MTSRLQFGALVVLGFVGGFAFAGPTVPTKEAREPYRFKGTVTLEKQAVELGDARGSVDFAFGPLAAGNKNCQAAPAVSLTPLGVAHVKDFCAVSTDFGIADGGPGSLSLEVMLDCQVTSADTATVRACAFKADGGAVSLADAGYFVRVNAR